MAKKCPSGKHYRKSYRSRSGKRVKAACVKDPKSKSKRSRSRSGKRKLNSWQKFLKKHGGKGHSQEQLKYMYHKKHGM